MTNDNFNPSLDSANPPHFWGDKPYHSLDYYLKNEFPGATGEKIYRLSLSGGMTCPNRDGTLGTTGCIFCSTGGSGDFASNSCDPVKDQITQAKTRIQAKTNATKFIAYFQSYTNTYAPVEYLRRIFMDAISQPEIVALSIATRCDCLPDEVLELLTELAQIKPLWVELGLQTMYENTLSHISSGFTCQQYEAAIQSLQRCHIPVITHLILGLPGETTAMMKESVQYVAGLPVAGIKLQLLHYLTETPLGDAYLANPSDFSVFSLEEYCNLVVDCIELLPPEMVIHRLTGDGPKQLLLAPLWSGDKKRVLNTLNRCFKTRGTYQGRLFQ